MRHEGQKVWLIGQMFQLMEHLGIHKLHEYQLSQEITSRLRKHLDIVTLCITYWTTAPMSSCEQSQIMLLSWENVDYSGNLLVELRPRSSAGRVTFATSTSWEVGAVGGGQDRGAR